MPCSPGIGHDADLDQRLYSARARPQHLKAELPGHVCLGLGTDPAQLPLGRALALDDAERSSPALSDLGLVALDVAREDGVEDDRVELVELGIAGVGRVEVRHPRVDDVRLRLGIGARAARFLLRRLLRVGQDPAALGLLTGAREVDLAPERGWMVVIRPHLGDREGLAVEGADDVVLAPGRPARLLLALDGVPIPVRNRHVAALRRIRHGHRSQAQHRTVFRKGSLAALLEHRQVGLVDTSGSGCGCGCGCGRSGRTDLGNARSSSAATGQDEHEQTGQDRENKPLHVPLTVTRPGKFPDSERDLEPGRVLAVGVLVDALAGEGDLHFLPRLVDPPLHR